MNYCPNCGRKLEPGECCHGRDPRDVEMVLCPESATLADWSPWKSYDRVTGNRFSNAVRAKWRNRSRSLMYGDTFVMACIYEHESEGGAHHFTIGYTRNWPAPPLAPARFDTFPEALAALRAMLPGILTI